MIVCEWACDQVLIRGLFFLKFSEERRLAKERFSNQVEMGNACGKCCGKAKQRLSMQGGGGGGGNDDGGSPSEAKQGGDGGNTGGDGGESWW